MERKIAWEKYSQEEMEKVFAFAENYRQFLSLGKTERECVKLAVAEAKAHGYEDLQDVIASGKTLKTGDKVVDKRPNIAGNIYTENIEGINVHKYGAHIFHTNDKKVWNYITQFAEFNRFTNSPVANYKGELYSLPFNMYTFNKMWGVVTPEEAAAKIEEQRKEITGEPQNLEEQAISLVGRDIYEKLIKGYTEKQWAMYIKPENEKAFSVYPSKDDVNKFFITSND